jgi:predicted kinase
MKQQPLAIWVFGAIGSGKSTLLAGLPPEFRIIDQDSELEREMVASELPFDTRLHDAAQASTFAELRRRAADKLWEQVPHWRDQGIPLAFETTGNKPSLFRAAVEECGAAGYLNVGVALRCSLALCESRNRARRRVLPQSVVESSWRDFNSYLSDGTYAELFGRGHLILAVEDSVPNLMPTIASIVARDG